MQVEKFVENIHKLDISNLIGIPDSALKPFCDYINGMGKDEFNHYVPANEGAAIGMAIGSYLATRKPACVYMQNSGIGNAVNPLTSLANENVYGIPMLMIIGWRGEPGKKDEPQHKFMGSITTDILNVLDVKYEILSRKMTMEEISTGFNKAKSVLEQNGQFAFILKKDFLDNIASEAYKNNAQIIREDAIREIISNLSDDNIVVSTTGKISREVYEQSDMIREQHAQEFLTVGGMGHASMIALSIAKEKKEKRVYCLDGDGAAFMHMGNIAFIAKQNPSNLVHICLNNQAHESVGGMPTGAAGLQYAEIAKTCGYAKIYRVNHLEELQKVLIQIKNEYQLTFIEINVKIYSRENLGRPKESAEENKNNFMKYHEVGK